MHPVSEARIGQILNPVPMSTGSGPESSTEQISLQQIVTPRYASGAYTGPERRAQGYLIADVLMDPPTLQGQQAEAERRR